MENILQEVELINVSGGASTPLDHFIIRTDLCVKCNICVDYCTSGSIVFKNGVYTINQACCDKCGTCVGVCPVGAVRKDALT